MKNIKILVLPGDGIGPEVIEATLPIVKKVCQANKIDLILDYELIGHASILKNNQPITDEVIKKAKESDAVLLGAVGDPIYDNNPSAKIRPEQGLLKLRQDLGLFANIRPVKIFDNLIDSSPVKAQIVKNTDIIFFRELTGGIYFGKPRERSSDGKEAIDTMRYTVAEVKRIAKMAFEAAMQRRKKVMSVDKANVLESSRLWRETVNEVSKDYPEVELSHQFIDSATMKLLTQPSQYDVILTANLFGDILTDEASQIAGSMGLLASASIGKKVGVFEPIHGSAPDIATQNKANPLATILSAALMFEIGLGNQELSKRIKEAVNTTLAKGYRTPDLVLDGQHIEKDYLLGTHQMGQKVLEEL